MTRLLTAACGACVLGVAALAAAQTGQTEPGKGVKDLKPTTVTGCVVNKDGRLMVTELLMTGDLKRDVKTNTQGDMKPASYDLMGVDMSPHVGHKVELTALLDPSTPTKDKSKGDTETMGVPDIHGTLTVTAVKMISSSCP